MKEISSLYPILLQHPRERIVRRTFDGSLKPLPPDCTELAGAVYHPLLHALCSPRV